MERIVLAYSGGLDTSVAIPWLRERYRADVIAVTIDLGQGRELESVRERALAAGARRAHVLDVREAFAHGYVLPALKADALDEDQDPLATALGQPLIARTLVEIAGIERAAAVAHGCGEARHDQEGLDVTMRALSADLTVIAPAREWGLSRLEKVEYARRHGVVVPVTADSPFRADANLWGRSIEGPANEGPANDGLANNFGQAPPAAYTLTKAPAECPGEAAYVEIAFERGVPVGVNGVAMPLLDLMASLETIAGAHGVGRGVRGGRGPGGVASRVFYEAPTATVLHAAHRALQELVTPPALDRCARLVSSQYVELIRNGLWFTPSRDVLDGFVERIQDRVTGLVRLELFKGDCRVVDRRSDFAQHDDLLATPETDAALDVGAAFARGRIDAPTTDPAARMATTLPPRSLVGK